jgi:hypothetical protein
MGNTLKRIASVQSVPGVGTLPTRRAVFIAGIYINIYTQYKKHIFVFLGLTSDMERDLGRFYSFFVSDFDDVTSDPGLLNISIGFFLI